MNEIHQAYIKALAVCKRAIDNGKSHVSLQSTRDGGYRLAAVGLSYSGNTSYRFDMLPTDWAQNVVYGLREACLLSVTVDDIDEYFNLLNSV